MVYLRRSLKLGSFRQRENRESFWPFSQPSDTCPDTLTLTSPAVGCRNVIYPDASLWARYTLRSFHRPIAAADVTTSKTYSTVASGKPLREVRVLRELRLTRFFFGWGAQIWYTDTD